MSSFTSPRSGAGRSTPSRSGRPSRSGGGRPVRSGRPQPAGGQRPDRSRRAPRSGAHRPAPSPVASLIWNDIPVEAVDPASLPGFAALGLPAGLVSALARTGVASPFPIQVAVIPDILAGRDVLGRAATGSGKTLAFGLPLLARLEGRASQPRRPRGLVLVPTRELAMQVTDALAPLGQARGLTVRLVAGGLPIGKQIAALERGVDVLVCTPGRLTDLLERRACDLGDVEVTVLDEADHMADLGFLPVVRRLLDLTPSGGQRLLFSATLDGDVATLVHHYLTDPAAHAVAAAAAPVDTMTHHVFRLPNDAKNEMVAHLAARDGRTLLFVRTKHGADRLARQLGRVGVPAGALHGGRSQPQRSRALDAFRDGSVPVLVATDVAARGIHVDDVSLVVHVDPPADGKDYLHRSGRTARAGQDGTVVLLSTPEQDRDVRRLLSDARVSAAFRDARPGDEAVAGLTGARVPSGQPVARPEAVTAPRSGGRGPRRTPGDRPRAVQPGRASRHPQHSERRGRRPHPSAR